MFYKQSYGDQREIQSNRSIQAFVARMLKRELMKQLWPTERLEGLRARTGRIAASRPSWLGC